MVKLLYFSVNEWGNMGRRKPRLTHEFARQPEVASVLYVEPPVKTSFLDLVRGCLGSEHLGSSRRAHLTALLGQPRCVEPKVWAYTGSTKTVPLSRFETLRKVKALHWLNHAIYVGLIRRRLATLPGDRLVVCLTHPLQVHALADFPRRALLCYDWTDDWSQFEWLPVKNRQDLIDWNDRILREADLVFAVSETLYHRAKAMNECSYRAPNATDVEVLSQTTEGEGAPELDGLPCPIVGYVGQIGDKIDYELLEGLAASRPGWSFVLVGGVWANKRAIVERLASRPNVHLMGRRPYQEVAGFLSGFDVCILPHLRSPLTSSMDPIKLYDYLASGNPIVSTSVAGVDRFPDVVYVGDTLPAFLQALESAIAENADLRQKRLTYAWQNTWSQRAIEMWQILQHHLEKV